MSRMQWPLEKRIFPRTFTDTRNACRSVLAHISITRNHSGPRKQEEAFPTPQPELPSHPCADTTPIQVSPGKCKHLMLRNLVRVEWRKWKRDNSVRTVNCADSPRNALVMQHYSYYFYRGPLFRVLTFRVVERRETLLPVAGKTKIIPIFD